MVRNIGKLVERLGSGDPAVRRKAAEALGESDERAVYPLIKALMDENTGVQDAAMRSLISIGGETVAYMVLPLLRQNSYQRNTALIILRRLGAAAVPLLYPLLGDKDHDVRKFAIDLLSEIQTGVEPGKLVPLLEEDYNANVRAAAAKALGDLRYAQAIPQLIAALQDEEWVCFYALQALGDLGAVDAVGAITKLFGSPSEAVRFSAVESLGRLGSADAIPALKAFLPSASEDEKLAVVKSLIQIGLSPDLGDLCDPIILMYKIGDWEDKEIALRGLAAIKCREAVTIVVDTAGSLDPFLPDTEEKLALLRGAVLGMDAEDELLRLLEDEGLKYRARTFVIDILGQMKSRGAGVHLTSYLKHISRDLRKASVAALGEIGEASAVGDLLAASQSDEDAHVRRAAIEALGNISAPESFNVLLGLLETEKYGDILERIVKALLNIDAAGFLAGMSHYNSSIRQLIARSARDVDALLALTGDADRAVKIAAIGQLGRIGTEKALERISEFLRDEDAEIRKAAVIAFGDSRSCSSLLFNALGDSDPWVRFYAVKAVSAACDRDTAIERTGRMLDDDFIPVVMAAIDALRECGGREAFEALAARENHSNPDVRERIREALDVL